MKRTFFAILALCFLFTSNTIDAQKAQKFGHIDAQSLLNLMPERDSAELVLQKKAKALEDQLGSMKDEFESKYTAYLESKDGMEPSIVAIKEQELAELQKRIEDFTMMAQQQLQQAEAELMQPIIEKAKNAIEEVGKENNFFYIFDISPGVVLYNSPESVDVMSLVKQKLGLQ